MVKAILQRLCFVGFFLGGHQVYLSTQLLPLCPWPVVVDGGSLVRTRCVPAKPQGGPFSGQKRGWQEWGDRSRVKQLRHSWETWPNKQGTRVKLQKGLCPFWVPSHFSSACLSPQPPFSSNMRWWVLCLQHPRVLSPLHPSHSSPPAPHFQTILGILPDPTPPQQPQYILVQHGWPTLGVPIG